MTFRAQIRHVYLIKFIQAVWLLTTDGKVWMKRIRLNTAEVPMLMRQIFFIQGIQRKFWKKMEFIKNDVLLWQFMVCKNINRCNNSLCKSSADYEGAEIWIGKLMRGRNNTSAHSQLNIVLTSTLTLNALLLCIVKQPNLELESAACVYFKVTGTWWISAHPWGTEIEYAL